MNILSVPSKPLASLVSEQRQTLAATLQTVITKFQEQALFFWANPYGFTPQQVFDVYGTDAAGLCAASDATATWIGQLTGIQQNVTPAGVTLQKNQDGTVTVLGWTPPTPTPTQTPTPTPTVTPAPTPAETVNAA